LYGGTERVVAYLTDELVRLGHDVTLWASGESKTLARLETGRATAIRLDPTCEDPWASHVAMIERFARHAHEYDVAHFHIDYLHFSVMRRLGIPFVNTLHGRLDIADLVPLFQEFSQVPVVSISDDQRAPLPFLNYQATVHHGVPLDLYAPGPLERERYLAFLGRISPEKGVDKAIRIALRAGWRIRIAAKIDHGHKPYREYYETEIKPLLGQPGVEFLGEVNEDGKRELLQKAAGLLFPIDWPEPFGLVMTESFACGTPVIAFRRGSVPEVVDHGVTGFVVENEDQAVEAVKQLGTLRSEKVRAVFERRFSAGRMAADYVNVYRKLISANTAASDGASLSPLLDEPSLASGVSLP